MDLQLTGKVAWVTGGAGGIGSAIAAALAAEGARIALTGRTAATLEETARQIRESTGSRTEVLTATADVTDAAAVDAAAERIASTLGSIDIVINSAAVPGGRVGGSIAEVNDLEFLRELDEKLVGSFRVCQSAVPFMKRAGWGRLIHVGGLGARGSGSYSSPRTLALVHLSKTLSDELGPYGITSNIIHPGATRGPWLSRMLAGRAGSGPHSAEAAEAEMAAGYAIRRLLEASEIANVVAFLASPLSVAITGESIGTGGGASRAVTI